MCVQNIVIIMREQDYYLIHGMETFYLSFNIGKSGICFLVMTTMANISYSSDRSAVTIIRFYRNAVTVISFSESGA